jgi:Putative peptidoglycan binding domain
MRIKLLVVLVLLLLAMADVSQAGGRCGRWGGYWGGGWGGYYGGGWGGWYGPGWGGWGGWGWGPSFGVSYVAPVAVYRPVYVVQPRRVYATSAYATYSAPALYRAQTRLARLGYYRGPIDGDFGPMTNRAIRSYQADYGLPITGRLDSRTRASLGV